MNFAIVNDNDVVVNVIVAESLEIAQSLTDLTLLNADELRIGVGSFKENNIWYPPKPEGDFVWHEKANQWISSDIFASEQNSELTILSQEETARVLEQFLAQGREV